MKQPRLGGVVVELLFDSRNRDVLRQLNTGPFWDKSALSLQTQAYGLVLTEGFNRLLALEVLPDLELFPHQIAAVRKVLTVMRGRAVLADEVGLGKTIEAGIIAKEYLLRGLVRTVLVLVPASLIGQWRQEMTAKLGLVFSVLGKNSMTWQDKPLVLASIDTAKRGDYAPMVYARDWDLVIVDEAHHLKNSATVNWQFVNRIRKKFLLLLTATPVQNDLRELYNLITLLKPGQLQTYTRFKQEFMEEKQVAKNLPSLRRLLSEVMVRTTRSETLLGFPRRQVHTIRFPLSEAEAAFYRQLVLFARAVYQQMPKDQKNLLPLLVLLREACSSPAAVANTLTRMLGGFLRSAGLADRASRCAVQELLKLARDISVPAKIRYLLDFALRRTDKVLVFTEFRATQDLIRRLLAQAGISVAIYHGGLSRQDKEAAIEKFRTSARVMVSTESGGEGRNLQFCHVVVNYDLPWNPMRVEQRIGRVHRLGQSSDVLVVNLCSQDTIESYVVELLEKKLAMFQDVIGDIESILSQADSRSFQEVVGEAVLASETKERLERVLGLYGNSLSEALNRYREVERLNHRLFDE